MEMFDFGHNVTVKELKKILQSLAKSANKPSLHPASKLTAP